MGKKKSAEGRSEKKTNNDLNNSSVSNHKSGRIIVTDPRFESVHFDPRFQRVPKHQSKVKIDSRFERLFNDKNFASSSAPIDKRGKLKNHDSVNRLHDYYNIDDEQEKKKKKESKNITKEVEIETEDEEDIDNEALKKKLASDADLSSESEGDELLDESQSEADTDSTTSDSDDENEAYSDEEPEEETEKIPEIDKETHRLAVVNMDWSHVRATDLYVIMSSFVPQGGRILSVSVYPSEFGLKRMEEEAVKGPVGLFDSDNEKSSDEDEDDDEIDVEKLRAYEKSRLRYYFAVVECDSITTADHIYKNCDGMEFEKSSNMLDLRFIPDTMQFEHPPRDVAKEAPSKYEGLDFHTHALQQSKIHLTWDEDEPQRTKTLRRKLNDDQLAELELKEFLASDDGESDDENDGAADGESNKEPSKLDKYRSLIRAGDGSDEDDDNDNDMEVTFNTGLEDISKRILEKKKDKKSETVWEAHLRKQKEKKKARRNRSKDSSEDDSSYSDLEVPEQPDDFFLEEPSMKNSKMGKSSHREKQEEDTDKEQEASRAELELLLADDQEADRNLKGYNIKPKKAKGKKGKEIPVANKLPSVDLNDPRFFALISNPLFALDPTDAQYKRSAAYARQVAERKHKGVGEESDKGQQKPSSNAPLPSDDTQSKRSEQLLPDQQSSNPELSSMIRSMKRKAQQYQATPAGNTSRKIVPKHSSGLLPKLSSMFLSGKKKARHSKS